MSSNRRYRGKSQSLISQNLVEPETQLAQFIPRIKREIAPLIGIRVGNICDIKLMPHQLWVSYTGTDGRKCSQFFSYRRLPIWQEWVISTIDHCPTLQKCAKFSTAMRWERQKFRYPTETIDAIEEAIENRTGELKAMARVAQREWP